MVREADKYNAEVLKIAGFAMMTPFSRIAIQPVVVFNELGFIMFLLYFVYSLLLLYFGIACIVRGYDMLDLYKEH